MSKLRDTHKSLSKIFKSPYFTRIKGTIGDLDYKVNFFQNHGKHFKRISPWHGIPLKNKAGLYNCVIEMPKGTDEKMEVSTKDSYNPIKQDIKNGQLRYIKHGRIPYNYGMIPRTWENPITKDPRTNIPGDNDPLDIIEVSDEPLSMGHVVPSKVLGAIALIDEGETDWKVIVIKYDNPHFNSISNLEQLESKLPGTLNRIKNWYQFYKVCEGKQPNEIFKIVGPSEACEVISYANTAYHDLLNTFTLKEKSSVEI